MNITVYFFPRYKINIFHTQTPPQLYLPPLCMCIGIHKTAAYSYMVKRHNIQRMYKTSEVQRGVYKIKLNAPPNNNIMQIGVIGTVKVVIHATMADTTCVNMALHSIRYKKDKHLFTFDMEYKDKNRFYVNSNITSEIIPKDETISGRRQRRCRVRHKGKRLYTLWMWMMCLCVYKFMKRPPINQ